MSGLAWLNELMVWLGRWVPRITLIPATHNGVLFSRSGRVEGLPPGLWVWWPIAQDLQLVSLRRRTSELAVQLHQGEGIGLVVGWAIEDACRALTTVNEINAYLDDATQASLGRHIATGIANTALEAAICADLVTRFTPFGVRIDGVAIVQRSRVVPIKLLNDYAVHSTTELA